MKKNVVSVDFLNWISVLIVLNLSLSWSSEGSSEHQMTIRVIFFKKNFWPWLSLMGTIWVSHLWPRVNATFIYQNNSWAFYSSKSHDWWGLNSIPALFLSLVSLGLKWSGKHQGCRSKNVWCHCTQIKIKNLPDLYCLRQKISTLWGNN